MASLLAALSFLTLCPARLTAGLSQQAISNSRAWFPLLGLMLGLMLLGLERGAREVFPAYLTAAILLAFLVIVTRGLHLDGFMDVCDGLFGSYTRERRLEIMKDPHVGSFAVAGAVCLLLLKYGALVSLLSLDMVGKVWVLLLFPSLSRWGMVLLLGAFPYARAQGLGSPFHQGSARMASTFAALTALAAAALLGGIGGIGLLVGVSGLAWLLGWVMSRMLGGLTGDTYGATNEIAEAALLVAAVAIIPLGLVAPAGQAMLTNP